MLATTCSIDEANSRHDKSFSPSSLHLVYCIVPSWCEITLIIIVTMDLLCLWFSYALVIVMFILRLIYQSVHVDNGRAKTVCVRFKLENKFGSMQPPSYHSSGAGAFDLRAAEDVLIQPQAGRLVNTSLYLEIPTGHAGFIKGRSSLAKKGVWCFEGLVDSDYRGEVLVQLRNQNDFPYAIKRNDRIAQLVILEHSKANLVQVDASDELETTQRGTRGFGSTGVGSDDM